MILNNVIGSIHHYHNILFVIVCQSSIHNVFCVPYLLDQMPWLVLISPINFVQLLFKSDVYFAQLIPSLTWKRAKQYRTITIDRQGNLRVVADWFNSLIVLSLLHQFTTSFYVCTCYSCNYSSRPLQLLFESGIYFVQHMCMVVRLLLESCY